MMKGLYGAIIVTVVLLITFVYLSTRAPDSIRFNGTEYQLEREVRGTALYTPDAASLIAAGSHLRLTRSESPTKAQAIAALAEQLKKRGAARVGDGRFWQREDQSATHISVSYTEGLLTILSLTEKRARTDSSSYSETTFEELERVVEKLPRHARWLPTLF